LTAVMRPLLLLGALWSVLGKEPTTFDLRKNVVSAQLGKAEGPERKIAFDEAFKALNDKSDVEYLEGSFSRRVRQQEEVPRLPRG
jgi:hypothetical protein